MANSTLAAEFHTRFRAETQALSETVSQQLTGTTPVEKDAILSKIAKLRKDLLDATPYLPSFDRRQSELQIKAIEKQLEELLQGSSRGSSKPASKFSFKRSTPSKLTPSQSNTNTDRPNTPSEPQAEGADTATSQSVEGKATQGETSHSTVTSLRLHDHSGQFLTASNLFDHSTASELLSNADTPERDRITDISLSSLSNCVVDLTTRSGGALSMITIRALHVTGLKRCIILTSFVEGSALIHDCEQCVFVLACRQFRIHTSSRTDVYMHVLSTPILEKCSNMRFGPYTLPKSLLPSEVSLSTSQHANVQDFLWIRQTPSPNWSLLPEDQWVTEEKWPASEGQFEEVESILNRLLPNSGS
ncbi:TBCC-domain-containing protein [Serendipita vermifera]|nr:TBCC-domain-containing protein [Serendipita vermifera]